MAIPDWPENERPRERLLRNGASSLSDAELLAIFLRVGVRGKSAVDLARDLLNHFGSLSNLCHAQSGDFSTIHGMGIAKYVQLQAVMELAQRALREDMTNRDLYSSPHIVREWLRINLAHRAHEVFVALWLDAQNRLIQTEEIFRGTLTQTSIYPREIVKQALAHNAASVIFAHNHPSGMPDPSHADKTLTATLRQSLALIDVRVLDHFIVAGHHQPLSFAERGFL